MLDQEAKPLSRGRHSEKHDASAIIAASLIGHNSAADERPVASTSGGLRSSSRWSATGLSDGDLPGRSVLLARERDPRRIHRPVALDGVTVARG
jgi:hypothetical protein